MNDADLLSMFKEDQHQLMIKEEPVENDELAIPPAHINIKSEPMDHMDEYQKHDDNNSMFLVLKPDPELQLPVHEIKKERPAEEPPRVEPSGETFYECPVCRDSGSSNQVNPVFETIQAANNHLKFVHLMSINQLNEQFNNRAKSKLLSEWKIPAHKKVNLRKVKLYGNTLRNTPQTFYYEVKKPSKRPLNELVQISKYSWKVCPVTSTSNSYNMRGGMKRKLI